MDLIEMHQFIVRARFPAHRVKELMTHREPAPIYTMGSPPSEEQVKRRCRIEFLLMALAQDEWNALDFYPKGKRVRFSHEGYIVIGEISSVTYICGTTHHVELINARRERVE